MSQAARPALSVVSLGGERERESKRWWGELASKDALFQGGRDNEASGREIAQKAVTDLRRIIREHI